MKITHKLAALATAAVLVLSLAACKSFGKDDFFGEWNGLYNYPTSIDDENAGASYVTASTKQGKVYDATMWFSGKSENILETAAPFYTVTKRYKSTAAVGTAEDSFDINTLTAADVEYASFWFGAYKLKNNSNYTAGDLVLTYYYGFNLTAADGTDGVEFSWTSKDKSTTKTLAELIELATGKTPAADLAALVPNNSAIIEIAEDTYSTDIETFTFSLDAPDFVKGYTKMSATEKMTEAYFDDDGEAELVEVRYNKGSSSGIAETKKYGETGFEEYSAGCDWGVKSRSFDLIGTDAGSALGTLLADYLGDVDDDEYDSNARSVASVPAALAPIYVEGADEYVAK